MKRINKKNMKKNSVNSRFAPSSFSLTSGEWSCKAEKMLTKDENDSYTKEEMNKIINCFKKAKYYVDCAFKSTDLQFDIGRLYKDVTDKDLALCELARLWDGNDVSVSKLSKARKVIHLDSRRKFNMSDGRIHQLQKEVSKYF